MKYVFSKQNKIILSEMVRSDFKLRYQNSVLGYLWSLLRPLLLSITLYVVFVKFLGISKDIRHYASYLLLGIMLWTFFIEVTSGGVGAVVGKGDLIRKISIPRYLTVLSTSASALINFGFNLVILLGIMIFSGVEIKAHLLPLIPLLLIELYIFAISLAFILSATFVKLRDLSFIWEVFTQMYFYITPIIYPMSLVLEKHKIGAYGKYLLLNPMGQIIQDMRYILVTPQTQTTWQLLGWMILVPLTLVVLLAVFAVRYFSNESKSFAENV